MGTGRRAAGWAWLALGASALMAAPAAGAGWSDVQLPGPAEKVFLLSASCPTQSLCALGGTNNLIASSTNPGGPAAAWDFGYAGDGPWPETGNWPTEFISGKQIQGMSCPSPSLCVGVTDKGFIYSTTHPTGPASTWKVAQVEGSGGRNLHLEGISCPSVSLCVAVTGSRNDSGEVLTSTNPTGGAGAWQVTRVDESLDLRAVSCPTLGLCVAVGDEGRIVSSTDPTGGPSAWRIVGAPGGPGSLRAIACVGTSLCLTGNKGGNLLTTSDPAAGSPGWKEFAGGGSVQITGVACASASACLAVDDNGDLATSTDPTGGKTAWSFGNLIPFTPNDQGGPGNALFGASCPSTSFCVVTGARGQIFTSTTPFARQAAPQRPSRRRRRPKRPRVKIAGIHLPFRSELRRGNGRVQIRFYARGRVRSFLCKLDHGRFKRCRSPKRYRPVGVGKHLFEVRAIGVTGLKGPIARERFVIHPLCPAFPHRRALDRICS
jgi:hypothetical protein